MRKKKSVKDQTCHGRRIAVNSKAPDLHRRIGEKNGGWRKSKKREEEERKKKKEGLGKVRKNVIVMASVPIPQGPLPLSSLILNLREISN